jgi:hypothetical protein
LQVLTALELARQARIAANRAYLAGLGLGPQAMHGGQVGGQGNKVAGPSEAKRSFRRHLPLVASQPSTSCLQLLPLMSLCCPLYLEQVAPLAPNDPVMLAAARELASRAASEQGLQQVLSFAASTLQPPARPISPTFSPPTISTPYSATHKPWLAACLIGN